MFNYDFTNELVVLEKKDTYMEIDGEEYKLCLVITDKNVLIFNDVSSNSPLLASGVHLPEDYLLELSMPINKINYTIEDGNTYIKYYNSEIVIYNFIISNYLK